MGVTTSKGDPPKPVIVEPVRERIGYDIAIPITKPRLVHDIRKLSDLDVAVLKPIFEQEDLAEVHRVKLKLEFAHTETEVSQVDIGAGELPPPQQLLGSITNKVIDRAKLPNRFAELYPAVRDYVATRCFGQVVDLESDPKRRAAIRLLAGRVGELKDDPSARLALAAAPLVECVDGAFRRAQDCYFDSSTRSSAQACPR